MTGQRIADTVKVGMLLVPTRQYLSGLLLTSRRKIFVRKLRAAYDKALSEYDLLLMPTTRMMASEDSAGRRPAGNPDATQLGANHQYLPVQHHLIIPHLDPVRSRRRSRRSA